MALNLYKAVAIAMGICCLIEFSLVAIQIKGFRWYSMFMKDNSIYKKKGELVCLYGIYVLGSLCSLQCVFNHISRYFPQWYCIYGMSICVILHEATKTVQYGFFLQRAKSSIHATKINILPAVITKYILPIYITLYLILYSIICPITFRGLPTNRNNSLPYVPTDCLFDQYESSVFYVSVGVEIFNSVFFIYVFAYPLCKITHEHIEVIKMVKYNIIFSSISCVSSVAFLLYRALSSENLSGIRELKHYVWLGGNIDLVINAICTYLMVTANRKYLQYCQNKILTFLRKHRKNKDDNNNRDNRTDTEINKSKHNNEKKHNDENEIQLSLVQMDSMLNKSICSINKSDKVNQIDDSNAIDEDFSETFAKSAKTTDTVTTTIITRNIATKQSCTPFPNPVGSIFND